MALDCPKCGCNHAPKALTNCHWCNAEIIGLHDIEIKFFWNTNFEGYPICKACLSDYVYGNMKFKFKSKQVKKRVKKVIRFKNPQSDIRRWIQ